MLTIATDLEVQDWEAGRRFGSPKYIAREMIVQHWDRIVANHGLTLPELRRRGGLTAAEYVCALLDQPLQAIEHRDAVMQLNTIIAARMGFRLDSRRADLPQGRRFEYAGFYANGLRTPAWNSTWEVHEVVARGLVIAHPKPHGGHEHLLEWNTQLWRLELLN